jgi:hypothetical protein
MWDIAQALGSPTVFIRYNPDQYRDSEGQRVDPALSVREAALISWAKTLASPRAEAHRLRRSDLPVLRRLRPPRRRRGGGAARPIRGVPSALTDADIDELLAGLTLE